MKNGKKEKASEYYLHSKHTHGTENGFSYVKSLQIIFAAAKRKEILLCKMQWVFGMKKEGENWHDSCAGCLVARERIFHARYRGCSQFVSAGNEIKAKVGGTFTAANRERG